ncbi:hypothetical protein V6N13_124765 [Hibiscus sabdariffa]
MVLQIPFYPSLFQSCKAFSLLKLQLFPMTYVSASASQNVVGSSTAEADPEGNSLGDHSQLEANAPDEVNSSSNPNAEHISDQIQEFVNHEISQNSSSEPSEPVGDPPDNTGAALVSVSSSKVS